MNWKQHLVGILMLCVLSAVPAFAADPSMHQVYEAAESGRLDQAQAMMQEVLKTHPNSAKAHYVEAELLSKQHQLSQARRELATAEKLSPGLNFADSRSVRELRAALEQGGGQYQRMSGYVEPASAPASQFPWGMAILVVGGVIVFMFLVARFFANRSSPVVVAGGNAYGAGPGLGGYGGAQPMGSYGPYPSAPSGGSGILGSLATGAAIGAGVVAGEALMDRIIDGPREREADRYTGPGFNSLDLGPDANNDMGGQDFGISDTSWDDGGFGSSSSDDWN